MVILLFVYAREIFVFWLKDAIVPEMILVMRVLIISEVARGFFGIWLPSLVGMGHLRSLTAAAITAAVGAIVMELILLRFGIVSVPMAPAVALVIALWAYMGLWLPFYGLYKSAVNPFEYFRGSLLGPVAATLVSIGVLKLFYSFIPEGSVHWLLMLLASGLIVLICFTVISLRTEAAELLDLSRKRFTGGGERSV
jgi:hypothetical protein